MNPRPAALALVLLAPGCQSPGAEETDEGQLRRRAGFDFDCPAEALTPTHLGGTGAPLERWGAAGCGQRAVYQCIARDTTVGYPRGVCVWQRESGAAPTVGDAGADAAG